MGERNLAADAQFKLDLTKDYPTDQGHYPSAIKDAARKRKILMHGSYRPMGPYQDKDDNGKIVTNFNSSYYHQFVNNIQALRGWLCYSMELMKPYYEVCWLFADRLKQTVDQMICVNGVSGSTHNMLEKMKRHEKTAHHTESSHITLFIVSGNPVNLYMKKVKP